MLARQLTAFSPSLAPSARQPLFSVVRSMRRMSAAAASKPQMEGTNPLTAIQALRQARAVCFDVDSTVITVEAIDEFAAFAGKKEAVAALTAKAMGGSVKFEEALASRLSLIDPTTDLLERFLKEHEFVFTEGVVEFMTLLRARGAELFLVSGGFTQMIFPLADVLSIPRSNVFANTILFDEATGRYTGFDETAPTSRDGGKPAVVKSLKERFGSTSPIVMIGDGATDMQARPPADAFIGYGGVVERVPVKAGADLFLKSFNELSAHLQ